MTQPVNQGVRLPGALGRLQAAVSGPPKGRPVEQLPKSVGGGFGNVPAAPINTAAEAPEPRRMSAAQAQQLMTAELIAAVRSLAESSTEIAGRLARRGAVNGVLDVFFDQVPTAGNITRSYEVAIGSVGIVNHGTTAATLHSGPPGPSAPTRGTGIQRIEAGSYLVVPIADRTFTVWADPATNLSVQVFTGLQPWGAGAL